MGYQPGDPAILFDLDGTLVDTAYEHAEAWSTALRSVGIIVPKWKIHRRIGMSGKSLLRQVLRETAPRRKVNAEQLEKKHDAAFRQLIRKGVDALPGAQELIRFVAIAGVRWAIATTGGREQTKTLLRGLRLPSKAVIVTGDDVAKAKPSPNILVAAAARIDVPIDHCIVVGDSIWDMLAAGRRRALSVGLLSGGYSQEELEQAGAFRVYADASDVLEHIEDVGIDR